MRLCEFHGCERKHHARGFCKRHYKSIIEDKSKVNSRQNRRYANMSPEEKAAFKARRNARDRERRRRKFEEKLKRLQNGQQHHHVDIGPRP